MVSLPRVNHFFARFARESACCAEVVMVRTAEAVVFEVQLRFFRWSWPSPFGSSSSSSSCKFPCKDKPVAAPLLRPTAFESVSRPHFFETLFTSKDEFLAEEPSLRAAPVISLYACVNSTFPSGGAAQETSTSCHTGRSPCGTSRGRWCPMPSSAL